MNTSQIRKIQEHSLTKKIKLNDAKKSAQILEPVNKNFFKKKSKAYEVKIQKRFKELSTTEEFFEHLDSITSNVYNLIIENNNKYIRNMYLKLELENVKKFSSNEINHSNYLKEQISLNEKVLEELKIKNSILLQKLNNLKDHQFQRKVKSLLVIQYIHKIYFNIKKENKNLINITKEMIISFGEKYYLKIIEDFFLKTLKRVKEIKKIRPNDYNYFKNKLDRLNKKEAFYNFQKLLAEKLQIKIDNVLKKAEKVIYEKHRKTNDYRINPKKQKIIKTEVKKSDYEIFLDYLNDDND